LERSEVEYVILLNLKPQDLWYSQCIGFAQCWLRWPVQKCWRGAPCVHGPGFRNVRTAPTNL